MKTDFSVEDLDRLMPQAVGWLTKIEVVKRELTPAKRKALQARIDDAVAARLAEADRG